jgi:hypothetical protein
VDPQEPLDDQPDPHAAARERRAAKRRHGMQESGRSTKTVLPDIIAWRGREAGHKPKKHAPPGRSSDDDGDAPD